MTLPKNAVPYADCSLQELRKFITDRHIPCEHALESSDSDPRENHSSNEIQKLIAALLDSDATITFRFFDLPIELRNHIYALYMLDITENEPLTKAELFERLLSISCGFEKEARDVFERGKYPILPSDVPRKTAALEWEIGRIMRLVLKETRKPKASKS